MKITEVGSYVKWASPTFGSCAAVHGKYLILFRMVEKTVRVDRMVHGARNLGGTGLDSLQ